MRGKSIVLGASILLLAQASTRAEIFVGEFAKPPASNYTHVLEIPVPADGQLQIALTTSATLSFSMATAGFFDSDGTTRIGLISTGAGTNEVRTYGRLRAGKYHLFLFPTGNSYGSYRVETTPIPDPFGNDVEPNDTVALARPIAPGQVVSGHIGYEWQTLPYDRNDYYEFSLSTDGAVNFAFNAPLNFLYAEIRDSSGDIVIASTGIDTTPPACSTCTNLLAPRLKAGNYIVRIGQGYPGVSWGGYSFDFQFSEALGAADAEPNDTGVQAGTGLVSAPIAGHLGFLDGKGGVLESIDYADWWEVAFPHGGDLRIVFSATRDLAMKIDVFKPDGVTLVAWRPVDAGQSTNTIIRNVPSGNYLLKFSATRFYWGTYSVTVEPGAWGKWLERYFTAAEINAGPHCVYGTDSDGDGCSNLAEFAFGLDPRQLNYGSSNMARVVVVSDAGGMSTAQVVFRRPTANAGLFRWIVETRSSLTSDRWNWAPWLQEVIGTDGEYDTVRMIDPAVVSGARQNFYRVRVELLP